MQAKIPKRGGAFCLGAILVEHHYSQHSHFSIVTNNYRM